MYDHFADRVLDAIRTKNAPACVGLDPVLERLPSDMLRDAGVPLTREGEVAPDAPAEAIMEGIVTFGRTVIDAVAEHVPIIKINIAFFEPYAAAGVRGYLALVKQAREAGLIVIGDVKRADIGHSSAQYALAHLGKEEGGGAGAPDAITVNPYFGFDAIRPFISTARATGRGLFVLVQTSNSSAVEVQGLRLSDGSKLCERVGKLVQTWADGEGLIGDSGYSSVGAVVSPRDVESTARIRAAMPRCLFLVPGFGAQGRTPEEVAECFKPDGTGAVVNASRSVIYAYQDAGNRVTFGNDWPRCIKEASKNFVSAIRNVLPS